eukprot:GHVR01029574.1.p1 GENE.GHVR01029574.1~~GHVR01029574.1.p1  ORF type:complete len:254 (+),score=63.98 GHVR01029574.1:3-764(+)
MKLPKVHRMSLCPGGAQSERKDHILPTDIIVGHTLPVYGRTFYIYDCDAFTRDFYIKKYNIEQKCERSKMMTPVLARLSYPPHHGIGQPEDSFGSCISLLPSLPKVDYVKRHALSDVILRFEGRMLNGCPEDSDRRFIIAVRPSDDSVGCWEIRRRNSGFVEGKFSELGRKHNNTTGKFFQPSDFYPGAVVCISACYLYLIRTDVYTKKFMSQNKDMWPDLKDNIDGDIDGEEAASQDNEIAAKLIAEGDNMS